MLSTIVGNPAIDEHHARTSAVPGVFSTPVMVNDNKANDQTLPVIVVTPSGMLFLAWQDSRLGNGHIYTSTSVDNGTTYSPNVKADDSTDTTNPYLTMRSPAAAVTGNGTLLLVWQDNRKSWDDYDIFFAKSYDGGKTFKKNVKVDDSNLTTISWQERPSITVSPGGTICVAWTDDRDRIGMDPRLRIRVAYSTDWGATFSASTEISPSPGLNSQDQASLVSNGNRIFLAYMDNVTGSPHPYLSTSTNGGKSFSTSARLDSTGTSRTSQSGVKMAPMPGGGSVAVWQDSRNGPWDIYGTTVSANGKVSASDFRVDDDITGSSQAYPSVSADQLGNIYAAWTNMKDGSSSGIRFSFLVDGNSTFNASIEVAKPGPIDYQRTPALVSPQPGLVIVAWQDDKSGTEDIYSSTAYFPELFGLSLVSGWNFISIPSDGYGYNASTLGLKKGDSVVEWNTTTQSYGQGYIVGISPPIFDFAIAPSTGYWIYAGAHERINLKGSVPTSKQNRQMVVPNGGGWTIVGFESLNTTRHASDIAKMLNVTGNIDSVVAFDSAGRTYTTYLASLPPTDFTLVPGKAYWVHIRQTCTMTYTP